MWLVRTGQPVADSVSRRNDSPTRRIGLALVSEGWRMAWGYCASTINPKRSLLFMDACLRARWRAVLSILQMAISPVVSMTVLLRRATTGTHLLQRSATQAPRRTPRARFSRAKGMLRPQNIIETRLSSLMRKWTERCRATWTSFRSQVLDWR